MTNDISVSNTNIIDGNILSCIESIKLHLSMIQSFLCIDTDYNKGFAGEPPRYLKEDIVYMEDLDDKQQMVFDILRDELDRTYNTDDIWVLVGKINEKVLS